MTIKLTAKDKIKVLYPSDVYSIMKKILLRENKIDRNKEHLWVVGLNGASTILFIELVALGSSNTAPVEPMQVFRVAVLKGATSVILVHNHPSDDLTPSKGDKMVTDRLVQCGKILHIKVADHLIITEKQHYSFSKTGLLAEIEKNSAFLLGDEKEAQLRSQAEEIGKLKGKDEERKLIAKSLKAKGIDIQTIEETTGLSEEEIKGL